MPAVDLVAEKAAYWVMKEEEAQLGNSERASLEEWLEQGEHRAAYEKAKGVLRQLDQFSDAPEIMQLRSEALEQTSQKRNKESYIGGAFKVAASIGFVAIGLAIIFLTTDYMGNEAGNGLAYRSGTQLYETDVGQQSEYVLEDGSSILLNTSSRLKVRYSDEERIITLLAGQAIFDVEKDKQRPFVVVAGSKEITAIGTQFDVRYGASKTLVTLVEGSIQITDQVDQSSKATLIAGQQYIAEKNAPPQVVQVDTAKQTSWRLNQVVFTNDLLIDAVNEMNRYSNTKIYLASRDLYEKRISGVFNTGAQLDFVAALESYFSVVAQHSSSGESKLILLSSEN